MRRTQRRSDGTLTLDGVRFELPGRLHHLTRVAVRYARWDLSRRSGRCGTGAEVLNKDPLNPFAATEERLSRITLKSGSGSPPPASERSTEPDLAAAPSPAANVADRDVFGVPLRPHNRWVAKALRAPCT